MAVKEQYTCDCGCGAVKGEVNRWWLLRVVGCQMSIRPWDTAIASQYAHASGEDCAQRIIARWMGAAQ